MRLLIVLVACLCLDVVLSYSQNKALGSLASLKPSLSIRGLYDRDTIGITATVSSRLFQSNSDMTSSSNSKTFDFMAVLSYVCATSIEVILTYSFLDLLQRRVIDNIPKILSVLSLSDKAYRPIRIVISVMTFFFLSLRQRVFSPLDNRRPQATANDPVFKERLRPSWQPPPMVFPIVWSTIAVLRSVSSTLVYLATGSLCHPAIMMFVTHLAVGDTWNTINNVENRLGTSVVGVGFVWLTLARTLKAYYDIRPTAAYVLAPSLAWISVASCLIYSIWRLNYAKFDRPSLYPSKEEGPLSQWRVPLSSWKK
jgi:translocator protein